MCPERLTVLTLCYFHMFACSLLVCTNVEQAEPTVQADRPQGQGARKGSVDVPHNIRPEDPSVL